MNLTLFDLDGTLLPIDSDHAFGEFMVSVGWAGGEEHRRRNDAFYVDYRAGRLDMHAYIDFATSCWRQRPDDELRAMSARFMDDVIAPALRDPARNLVQRHRQAGDLIAIVTATNDFITGPIARAFGVTALIATELERDPAGRVTGGIRGVPALREGKITRVGQWLAAQGRGWNDFEQVTVYSDSPNDLPLLERATRPVATNPDPALESIAAERGWTVLKLFG